MARDVNGIVYLIGKEKAIVQGFLGKTINPDIVFLFVNKNGMKYYINYDILKNIEPKKEICAGKFYELNRIERGRRFSIKEAKKGFETTKIENIENDIELSKTIEFNKTIINRELEAQKKVRKKKNAIIDIMTLLIVLIVFALTKKLEYAIPFIIIFIALIVYICIYNKKMAKYIEKI